jgi:hypothetical protein
MSVITRIISSHTRRNFPSPRLAVGILILSLGPILSLYELS